MISNLIRTAKLYRTKLGVKVACLVTCLPATLLCGEVTIYRDGWGVPHIYGETNEAVAFGFGYAQAEDRLDAVLTNYARANGRLAALGGPAEIASDFQQRLWGHRQAAERELDRMPPEASAWTTAFAAGVNAYLTRENPEPAQADSITAADILTLGRSLFWRGFRRQLDAEHARGSDAERPDDPKGILWGLAPEQSAHDAVTLVVDPAESWSPGYRWYEAHLHGPDLHVWGLTYPGLPLPVFGHNRRIGWGWLPDGPDTGDVYRITFDGEASSRYRWNGRTREATLDTFRIPVSGGPPSILTGQRTHLGPILHRTGRVGYAYRVPEAIGAGQVSQLFAMIRSTDFPRFYEAIRPGQLGPATLLYGDTSGVLFYIRSGHVPIRPESVEWRRAITTDIDSEWIGFHVQEDLVQLLDPHTGWIVDANTSPDLLTPYGPLTPDRFPGHIFNTLAGYESPQSERLRDLLGSTRRLNLAETTKIAMDTYVIDSQSWLAALFLAVSEVNLEWTDDEQTCLGFLRTWDGRAEPDRMGLAIYLGWREACEDAGRAIDRRSVEQATGLSRETKNHLIEAFRVSVRAHKQRYGHLDVRWQEIHRMKRDDRSWGVPGVRHPLARTIRDIRTQRQRVVDYAVGGQSAPTVILFDPKGIRSFSALPFGQSDQPDSPHRWDQADALFTQGILKPTRFDSRPKDLIKKEVLRLPEDLLHR